MTKVISLHWGFSVGGVSKYTVAIDRIPEISDVEIKSVCILSETRKIDDNALSHLNDKLIIRRLSLFDTSWITKLKMCVDEYQPDIIITHGFNGHIIASILLREYPLVCSYHGEYHGVSRMQSFLGYFYNKFTFFYISKMTIGCACVSEYSKKLLQAENIPSTKLTVIHNGINTVEKSDDNCRLRQVWGVENNETLIGVACRLDPIKGIEFLLDALELLLREYQNVKLVIIGSGPLEKKLQYIVAQNGLANNVIFTGFRDDIDSCLRAMDIFMLPSLAECHSIALLEAMRATKLIIATDVGGNTESVRNHFEGIIVTPSNSAMLAESIGYYLDNPLIGVEYSQNAFKRFNSLFTEEVMVNKTADWLVEMNNLKG